VLKCCLLLFWSLSALATPRSDLDEIRESAAEEVVLILIGESPDPTWADAPVVASTPHMGGFMEAAAELEGFCPVAVGLKPDGTWMVEAWSFCEPAVVVVPDPEPAAEEPGRVYPESYLKRRLAWDGDGRVIFGKKRGITTFRFTKLTGDASTRADLKKLRHLYWPGAGTLYVGVGAVGLGVGAGTLGFVFGIFELLGCLSGSCDFTISSSLIRAAGYLIAGGFIAAAAGAVILVGTLFYVIPKMRLLKWYTPADVHDRINAYNADLRDELGVAWRPPQRRGGLSIEGLALRGRF